MQLYPVICTFVVMWMSSSGIDGITDHHKSSSHLQRFKPCENKMLI